MTTKINALNAIITLDVFNTYFDILNERIIHSHSGENMEIYVGDCFNYALRLLMNNGWSLETDSAEQLFGIMENVLCLFFTAIGINGQVEWADDLDYIIVKKA